MSELAENKGGTVRPIGRPFQPGQSGNPGGGPKGVARTVREVCGGSPLELAQILLGIARDKNARKADRIHAIQELMDRGWGKAPAFALIEGADPLELDEVSEAIASLVDELSARREARAE
jgi:hypothetical protein